MRTTLLVISALAGLPFPARILNGQKPADNGELDRLIARQFPQVAASVVCIRTLIQREFSGLDPHTGRMATFKAPVALHGTGIVIDSIRENGRTEYIILTNHHVADPSNYFEIEGRFLRERKDNHRSAPRLREASYLVDSSEDDYEADDILLVEIGRDAAGDAALLKTVGARRPLTVFAGVIGFEDGAIAAGTPVMTAGFPIGEHRVTGRGELTAVDYYHELGIPHHDYAVDLPLQPGQSGSPVFAVGLRPGNGEPEVVFTLIGLLHARNGGTPLVVPYPLWKELLDAAHR
ncbi:MAG TPA: serine protease [Longimicrobiales bacterium]